MLTQLDDLPSSQEAYDICIVGAGAAGLTMLHEFAGGPLRVAVLESGGVVPSKAYEDLDQAEVVGLRHTGVRSARVRAFGGTTRTWGGQALPFLAEDFPARPWVAHSGWPIGRDSLAPYYLRAGEAMGLKDLGLEAERPWKAAGVAEPVFSPNTLDLIATRWSRQPDFGATYLGAARTSTNLTVICDATVVRLNAGGGDTIASVTIASSSGRRLDLRARHFVLAPGAIETCRLLLASEGVMSAGRGQGADLVGRYFQDHAAAVIGLLVPADPRRVSDVFDPFYVHGEKRMPRLMLDPGRAAQEHLLHASVQVFSPATAAGPLGDLKALAGRLRGGKLDGTSAALAARTLRAPGPITAALWRRLVKRRGVTAPGAALWVEVHAEQEPLPNSRITLSQATDRLGMPRARLDWRLGEMTGETLRATARLAAREFSRTGLGKVVLDDWVTDPSHDWRDQVGDVFHQCGGARMAANRGEGVVDPDCKVFWFDNLHIASSAVFPTSGFSNPTLTMMALAVRLADQLKSRLSADAARP